MPIQSEEQFTKVRSIIHGCPAIKLPQTLVQRLGMTAQIVALKGADDALADMLVARLNSSTLPPMLSADGGKDIPL